MNNINPEYKQLHAIAERINLATTSVEISNGVRDMLIALENKPMEARVLAFSFTNAALVSALCETAAKFAQGSPDKLSDLSHVIVAEYEKQQKDLDNRPDYFKVNGGLPVSYLKNFEDTVASAESPEAFECAMSKIRPHMADKTSLGVLINRLVEKGLSKLVISKVIPEYLSAFPEDKLTADIAGLWQNLESITGASTIPDIFVLKSDDTQINVDD